MCAQLLGRFGDFVVLPAGAQFVFKPSKHFDYARIVTAFESEGYIQGYSDLTHSGEDLKEFSSGYVLRSG